MSADRAGDRQPIVPRATYRLQLHAGFDFAAGSAAADYLAALGVSHVYSSPYLQAAPGSTHGYDVVDPRRVNAELGGPVAHQRFSATLGDRIHWNRPDCCSPRPRACNSAMAA